MFNDDGLGAAMAEAYTRDLAKGASDKVSNLEKRVADLEAYALRLTELLTILHPEVFPTDPKTKSNG